MANAVSTSEILEFKNLKDYMLELAFISVGVIAPIIFHIYGLSGPVFLPMHWTIYCAGLIYGYRVGAFTGFAIPVMNHLITGMPATAVLPLILFETTVYGLISGILRKNTKLPNFLIVIFSMISGRLIYFLTAFMLNGASQAWPFVLGIWKLGLISSVMQILFIPLIVKFIKRRI